jgi:nicotinic acid phosphoribosyltransferase
MKDNEIKELNRILATSGKYITYAEKNYVLDYITKLEKEKTAIKERCEYLQRSCERKEEQMLNYREEYLCQEDYKTRCQLAIEYIKDKQKIQYKYALSHIECDELLNILQGDNKE